MSKTRNRTVGILAALAGAAGLWWLFRDDEKEPAIEPEDFPDEPPPEEEPEVPLIPAQVVEVPTPLTARPVIDLTTSGELYSGECAIEGTKVDKARDGAWVISSMKLLGFPVSTLLTTADKNQVKKLQTQLRSMNLGAMANAPPSFIDGKVGLCTIDGMIEAAIMFNDDRWPGAV
jgi:hypothetical protein